MKLKLGIPKGSLKDATVQSTLKLSTEQKENINTIIDESQKGIAELFKEAAGGNFQGMQEKMAALRKETNEKVLDVLNGDQKKTWTAMLGEEFKMPTFGGFKKFDFKKKKKDDE